MDSISWGRSGVPCWRAVNVFDACKWIFGGRDYYLVRSPPQTKRESPTFPTLLQNTLRLCFRDVARLSLCKHIDRNKRCRRQPRANKERKKNIHEACRFQDFPALFQVHPSKVSFLVILAIQSFSFKSDQGRFLRNFRKFWNRQVAKISTVPPVSAPLGCSTWWRRERAFYWTETGTSSAKLNSHLNIYTWSLVFSMEFIADISQKSWKSPSIQSARFVLSESSVSKF